MIDETLNIGDYVVCIKHDNHLNITKGKTYKILDIWNNMFCVSDDLFNRNYYYKLYFDKTYNTSIEYIEPADKRSVLNKEMVNHPDHYKGNKFEVIDIIEDYNLDFSIGNAVKYLLRAGKKDNTIQDLKKAIFYIQREISKLEK